MSSKEDKIKSQIFRIKELPTLPIVVNRVLKLISDPKATAQDLNKIIASDMALASKILRLANSAFYGLSRQVTTITEAVIYLGFNTVKAMALSISVFDIFKNSDTHYRYFSRESLWRHALACGIISRKIGQKIKYGEPETIFLSGILHDIGKLVIDFQHHSEFLKILEIADKKHVYINQAETEVLGVDHAMVGYWLAQWWKLPSEFSHPILHHHHPNVYQKNVEVAIVHIANALCRQLQLGNSGDELSQEIDPAALSLLNIPNSFIENIANNIQNDLEKAEVFLSFIR